MDRLNRTQQKRKLSLTKKMLFSVVATLGFFMILETILAVVGVQRDDRIDDPFVGFSDVNPLMELSQRDDGEKILSTAKNKLRWFNAQSFLYGWFDDIRASLSRFDIFFGMVA